MSAAIEHAPRVVLETLQLERLQQTIERVRAHPARRARCRDQRRAALDDWQLPFTVKDDLREHYPFGLLAVARSSCAASTPPAARAASADRRRLHAGRPRHVVGGDGALHGDGRREPGMVVHNAYGYGLFTGGLGFHQGAERLGALDDPGLRRRHRPPGARCCAICGGQVLCSTPSYALHIAQGLREAGIETDELALEIGMFGAEPWTEAMRAQLEAELGLRSLNVYGLSEIVGPGVAAECPEARDGLHVQEDHFLVEVIDPETGEPRPRRHRRRARLHDADQGGDAAAALPHRRHRVADPRALRVRAHVRAHERRSAAAATTC